MENDKKEVASTLEELESSVSYVCAKMDIYMKALDQISQADDQANPIALRNRARIALIQEPTTADKHNLVYISDVNKEIAEEMSADDTVIVEEIDKNVSEVTIIQEARKDIVYGPNDPGDEQEYVDRDLLDESSAELAKFDREMREDAEAAWRNTVLHPEHKSEYDEEE